MLHVHLIVAEAISDEAARELARVAQEHGHVTAEAPGFVSVKVDVEEDGRMILITTTWTARAAMLAYIVGCSQRQFAAATAHLLLGNFVTKVFQRAAEVSRATEVPS